MCIITKNNFTEQQACKKNVNNDVNDNIKKLKKKQRCQKKVYVEISTNDIMINNICKNNNHCNILNNDFNNDCYNSFKKI